MADWSKPSVGDQYANFLKYLNAKLIDVAQGFASAPTNPVDQTIRWNASNNQWEQYSASSGNWAQLAVNGVNFPSITLGADPVNPLQAATKQYVDSLNALITKAQNTANAALPGTGGTVTGTVTINTVASGASGYLAISGLKATNRAIATYTSGVLRWLFGTDGSAETGGNAGSTFFINRYDDAGNYLGSAMYIARQTGQTVFSTRPSFNGAIPWDSSNLPNPLSASNSNVNNTDLTIAQNQVASGDLGRLAFQNNTNGLKMWMRLSSTTGALEYINNAYNAVNFTFGDGGNFISRLWITAGGDLRTNTNFQFLGGSGGIYDYTAALRFIGYVGDYAMARGGGGSGNYSFGGQRNDGAFMGIFHGNGDFYYASQGWLTGIINGKATAGVWHHAASMANCGSGTSGSFSASGNTLTLTLTNTNCNCNCISNCSCFIAGTPVLMADGTTKAVEDVKIGDMLMGTDGPAEVWDFEYPRLGSRRLMRFENDTSFGWSEEHPCWTMKDGKQWWWSAGRQNYLEEIAAGRAAGLKDNESMREGEGHLYAHLDDGWRTARVVAVDASPNTQLYFPKTRKSQTLFLGSGWLFSGGLNEFTYDYHDIDWNRDRHTVLEALNACTAE